MKRITKAINEWWNGKQVRVDPSQPDQIGGLRVIHEYRTEYSKSALLAKRVLAFYLANWKWVWASIFGLSGFVYRVWF